MRPIAPSHFKLCFCDPTSLHGGHRLPIRRFERECEFLSALRHPNIVHYIGVHRDADTGLPVLLMELMDEDLNHYLEHSSLPIPYHLQVNICNDIALALSFLHANDVVHGNISSNAILLKGDAQVAKVGKVGDFKFMMSAFDYEVRPGCITFMPPEAFTDSPKYTEKIDYYSFGVVKVHLLTRLFPQPGNQIRYIDDPSDKYVNVPETERWHRHISLIDPSHPLLPITLDCLKDRDVERPTAHQLCERIGALKESQRYVDSKISTSVSTLLKQLETERQRHTVEQDHNREEIHRLREQIRQNEETRRSERELAQQLRRREREQTQSSQRERELRQQISDLQQQIRAEQQRTSRDGDQLREKDERIRELERRLEQSEVEALGSRVTQLQLLPQGHSWNVPRHEIQIIELLGSGASGLVSKGRFQGQSVAVKQIHGWILREVYALDEFKREVGIMAVIQHPNLVRFIAAVFDERVEQLLESPLLILELLQTNLRDAYKMHDLGPSKFVPIFRDIAYGLHYLHEHSEPIIHRDVSAPNILLEPLPGDMWRAKLSDFGSANFLKRAKTLGVGAIVYTAPEN